jgi:hypothetical protein
MNGRHWALKLGERFPDEDWIVELARRAEVPRETIERHLQEETEPPATFARAAQAMLDRPREVAPEPLPDGALDADDVPFSGIPQFLGKLRKD